MRQRRNGAFLAAVMGLAVVGGVLVLPATTAQAHGGMTFPSTRTYSCYVDGKAGGGGDLNPQNPACKAAVAIGGKQPLWDWFGNLISNAGGRHREIIPDGKLCGPTAKYDGYNLARTDWPTTQLQSGAAITFRYNAWAPHPGTWSQYVTRDGWNPSQPLKWSDLESLPFNSVTNPPINGSGPDGAEYTWNGTLPAKSGRHIIYSIWQRSDSPEAFYNCSDVNFGGSSGPPDTQPPAAPGTPAISNITGTSAQLSWAAATDNVGVTGYDVYRRTGTTDALVSSTSGTSSALSGLSPLTAYSYYVVAKDAAGNRSPASTVVTFTTTSTPPAGNCRVGYTTPSQWPSGFTATVKITNTGLAAIDGWTLKWTYADGQKVTSAWNVQVTQPATEVTAQNDGSNRVIAAGGTVQFGFNGSFSSANTAPTAFTLNGTSCTTS